MWKISPIFGLKYLVPSRYTAYPWCEQMYIAHIFDHHLYGCTDGLNVRVNEGHTALQNGGTGMTLAACLYQLMEAAPMETIMAQFA